MNKQKIALLRMLMRNIFIFTKWLQNSDEISEVLNLCPLQLAHANVTADLRMFSLSFTANLDLSEFPRACAIVLLSKTSQSLSLHNKITLGAAFLKRLSKCYVCTDPLKKLIIFPV